MSQPCALFIDLRRKAVDIWPEGDFTIAYIVTGSLEQTQDFFKAHYKTLATIAHVTCEINEPDVLHLLTRQHSVTRLSLAHDLIPDGLADHFALDAVIPWDHRKPLAAHQDNIDAALVKNVTHFSVYGLQDFALWQQLQSVLNERGLYFYDRFHAARPGHESPYQQHVTRFGNIIALHGWSRLTKDNHMQTKGPRARTWTNHADAAQREEKLLLGFSARHGLPLDYFTPDHIHTAVNSGLATVHRDRLCPTDQGLWDQVKLVSLLA